MRWGTGPTGRSPREDGGMVRRSGYLVPPSSARTRRRGFKISRALPSAVPADSPFQKTWFSPNQMTGPVRPVPIGWARSRRRLARSRKAKSATSRRRPTPTPWTTGPQSPGQVRLADVVEERAEEVADSDDVVEHVAVDLRPDREPPLEGRQPDRAAEVLAQVEGAEPPAAAQPEVRGGVGEPEPAVDAEGEPACARRSRTPRAASGRSRTRPVIRV